MLNLLNEEVLGLREELGESRNNNQQLHEKQMRMEQRMGEGRNRANGEIRETLSHHNRRKTDGKKGSGMNRQMYKKF